MAKSWDGNVTSRTADVVAAINVYYAAIDPTNSHPTHKDDFVLTTDKSQAAFTTISAIFEAEVNGYASVPMSNERLALMSLAWNSQGVPLDGKNLLGKGLLSALKTENRAAAWFQIRYQSDSVSNGNERSGIAKRRYFESQLFGLYNEVAGVAIPPDEALQTYAMMSELTGSKTNRSIIFTYENSFGDEVAAATDYNGVLGITVQTLQQALQPAANSLIQKYVLDPSLNPYQGNLAFSLASIDARDVQVAAKGGGSDLVASQRLVADQQSGYQLGQGTYLSSLLIAQDGGDTLDGSGSADDALIGGNGNDIILGGTGNDYIVAGKGDDTITLIGGNDTVVLGDANNPLDGGHDTVDASQDSGAVTYYVGAGTHETIKLGTGITTINLVSSQPGNSVLLRTLAIDAQWIAPGEWYDEVNGALLVQAPDPLTGQIDLNAAKRNIEIIYSGSTGAFENSDKQTGRKLSLTELQHIYAADANVSNSMSTSNSVSTSTVIELTLDNFVGSSGGGITLGAELITPTAPSGALQITSENSFSPGLLAATEFDNSGAQVPIAPVLVGPTDVPDHVWAVDGMGNADSIFGGTGDELLVADSRTFETVGSVEPIVDTKAFYIQAGSGMQAIIGGQGRDTLVGGEDTLTSVSVHFDAGTGPLGGVEGGAYTVAGVSGFDWITGGGGDDLIEAGTGAALIYGGTGADTIFGGSGNDTIYAGLSNYSDGLGDASIIDLYDENGVVADHWVNGIGGSSFADAPVAGTPNANVIFAGSGDQFINGGLGNDTIYGGSGHDTIVGNSGDKTIYGGTGNSVIYADENASLAAIFGVDWQDAGAGSSDTIYGGGGDDTIYGSGGNDYIYAGGGSVLINVGNGNSYIYGDSGDVTINGGSGNDTIDAGGGDDVIVLGSGNAYVNAGRGNSTVYAGAGSDTIEAGGGNGLFVGGSGTATYIAGVAAGDDTIDTGSGASVLQLTDGLDEASLVIRNVDGDLVLSDPGFGSQITVNDYFGNNAGVSLHFEDGEVWGAAEILQASMKARADGGNDTLVGSDGNDSITAGYGDTLIVGTSGNNTLTGGAGDDTIQGGSGADTIEGGSGATQIVGGTGSETYVFNLGGGSEVIAENTSMAGADTLKFGAGIDLSNIVFERVPSTNDLLVQFGDATDATITVKDFLASGSTRHRIGTFMFSDGTTISEASVVQKILTIDGTTGDDRLYGSSLAEHFDGKGGNDTVFGSGDYNAWGGDDTFVFNEGYGDLEIDEWYEDRTTQHPVLLLGAGITTTNLRVTTDGQNLILTDGIVGDEVHLSGMWQTMMNPSEVDAAGVLTVQLSDGSSLTSAQLIQMELASASSGADTLDGSPGDDYLDGKGGDDLEYGWAGNDTYVFNGGYGHLEIRYSYLDHGVVKLGSGIKAAALHVKSDGGSFYLTDGIDGDQIDLDDMWTFHNDFLLVRLSDGTTLTSDQLMQMQIDGGTAGSDYLFGTPNAEYFDGKGGNDTISASGDYFSYSGNDTFVFNAGYGRLDIYDTPRSTEYPVLIFGPGITASDLKVTTDEYGDIGGVFIKDGIAGDEIKLEGMFYANGRVSTGVSTLRFDDGESLSGAQLIKMALDSEGTAGDDSIFGTDTLNAYSFGNDLIDGQGGSDVADGEGGNDTFVFNAGYGALEIDEEFEDGQSPVLMLGTGIDASEIRVTKDYSNLILTDHVSGDQIRLDYMGDANYIGSKGVSIVRFLDGSTLSAAQLLQMAATNITGTVEADRLQGDGGPDLFDGKGGNDSLVGNGGNDTFVFNAGYGQLEINESYASGEQPVLKLGESITVAELQVSVNGNDLLLTDGISGDQITLDGMSSSVTSGVAMVQLADGTTLTRGQLLLMEPVGTTGNDTITGTSGADLIDGKGGNDSLVGNGGNDTFLFNAGYGQLEINESYTSGQQPVLQLGESITAAELQVSTSGNDLLLTDDISGDQITLDGMSSSVTSGVATVQLADGTTLTRSQLLQMEPAGTTGDDTITGTSGADLIDGKGGNDSLVGDGGNDTFVFSGGYGQLEINESYTSGQQPMLQLGEGITAAGLQASQSGDDLLLTDGVSGDQIALDGMWSSATDGVATVQLADGTTLTRSQLIQMTMTGTPSNNTITGTSGADRIDGQGGYDSVVGGGGNDTFVFNAGYGQLEISETYTSGQQPVLQLGEGITAAALQVSQSGNDLLLTDGVDGDQITFDAMWSSATDGVATMQLADGTTLTRNQLLQMAMTGTAGDDTLQGTSAADLIDGHGGHDSVVGAGGNDTFVFNSGYGQLEINESYTSGQQPVLQLGEGITAAALQVSQSGNDLLLTDGVNGDQITLDTMWSDANDGVATVQLADGTTLTRSQLLQMANPNPGDGSPVGGDGNDTLTADATNETLTGGTGTETFDFNVGFGQDTLIANSDAVANTIQFGAGIAVSDLSFSTDGSELVITATNSTGADGQASSITLPDHWINSEPVTDVGELVFSDGSFVSMTQINQLFAPPPPVTTPTTVLTAGSDNTLVSDNGIDLLQANAGNDTLTGGSGTDTLESGVGNSQMTGGTGAETYLFNPGFGQDSVAANAAAISNTIQFGAGITVSDLSFSTDGSELVITATNSTGADGQVSSITLPDHWNSGEPVTDVGELVFSDGSFVSMTQINQLFAPPPPVTTPTTILTAGSDNTLVSDNGIDLLQANAGNDTLTGGSGTDTLESGVGNSQMTGGAGAETYLFNPGFGQDSVAANAAAISNTVQFGAGITASDLIASMDGNDLVITATNSTGADGQASSITLPDHWIDGEPVNDVGEAIFSDGSVVSMAQINELFATQTTVLIAGSDNTLVSDNGIDLLQANAGNDTLTGGSGTDTLESGVGNSQMIGGTGAETYLFNLGFGQDLVAANAAAISNTVQFGAGITASDLIASMDGNDLVVTATNSTGADGQASSITLPDHWVDGEPVNDVGEAIFSDGSVVSMTQINQLFASDSTNEEDQASMASTSSVNQPTFKSTADAVVASIDPGVSPISNASDGVVGGEGLAGGHSLNGSESTWVPQVNPLIHAMASYTGSGLGGGMAFQVPQSAPVDLMLHAAA